MLNVLNNVPKRHTIKGMSNMTNQVKNLNEKDDGYAFTTERVV